MPPAFLNSDQILNKVLDRVDNLLKVTTSGITLSGDDITVNVDNQVFLDILASLNELRVDADVNILSTIKTLLETIRTNIATTNTALNSLDSDNDVLAINEVKVAIENLKAALTVKRRPLMGVLDRGIHKLMAIDYNGIKGIAELHC